MGIFHISNQWLLVIQHQTRFGVFKQNYLKYSIYDKEFLALLNTLKKLNGYYLNDRPFLCITDNKIIFDLLRGHRYDLKYHCFNSLLMQFNLILIIDEEMLIMLLIIYPDPYSWQNAPSPIIIIQLITYFINENKKNF